MCVCVCERETETEIFFKLYASFSQQEGEGAAFCSWESVQICLLLATPQSIKLNSLNING